MSPWIVIVPSIATVIGFVVVVTQVHANAMRRREEIWRSFASSRGWTFVATSGPWYRRQASAIEGTVDGAAVRIDTYVVRHGKSAVTYTRAAARLARPALSRVEASRRNFGTWLKEKFGTQSITTGHPDFDKRMFVRSESPGYARSVLDDDVRAKFLAIDRHADIKVEGDAAQITWFKAEKEPEVLEACARAAAALARSCARA